MAIWLDTAENRGSVLGMSVDDRPEYLTVMWQNWRPLTPETEALIAEALEEEEN